MIRNVKFKKLGKDFILLTIGSFTSKILVFILVPLYTTCLTTSEYGTVDLITTTVSLLAPLLSITISESVMRYALEKNQDKKSVLSVGMYITIFSFLILILFSPLILILNNIKDYYLLFMLYYIAYNLNALFGQFVKGINKVKSFTVSGIISTIVTVMLNILFLVCLNLGIMGYLLSMTVGLFSSVIYLFFKEQMNQYLVSIKEIDFGLTKQMIRYSIPLIPNSLAWWIVNSSDRYMLLLFSNVSIVGIYSVAYKIPTILTTFTSLFSVSMRISSIDGFKGHESNSFLQKTYNIYFLGIVTLTSILIVFTKFIAQILFKSSFYIAWQISPILLIGFMFYSLAEYLGVIYIADKKTINILYTCLLGAFVNIILNIFFIPILSGFGAALATMIGYFFIWITRAKGVKRIIPFNIMFKLSMVFYILIFAQIICLYQDSILIYFIFLIQIILTVYILLMGRRKNDNYK